MRVGTGTGNTRRDYGSRTYRSLLKNLASGPRNNYKEEDRCEPPFNVHPTRPSSVPRRNDKQKDQFREIFLEQEVQNS